MGAAGELAGKEVALGRREPQGPSSLGHRVVSSERGNKPGSRRKSRTLGCRIEASNRRGDELPGKAEVQA